MKKALLVLAVAVPFVVIGTVGVWQLSGNNDRRLGAITATDEPVALSWRGAWDAEAKYAAGQVVSYEGVSYVAESDTGGSQPEPRCVRDCIWAVMAPKGESGAQGPQGAAGPQGPAGAGAIWAKVKADGTIIAKSAEVLLSAHNPGLGNYQVHVNRDVSACALIATPAPPASGSQAVPRQNTTHIAVSTFAGYDANGQPKGADAAFSLAVFC